MSRPMSDPVLRRGVAVAVLAWVVMLVPICQGAITVGPWTFADNAFADNATQLDAGLIVKSVDQQFLNDAGLDDVLTGFTPTQGLANIGSAGFANHFQLDFLDLVAFNGPGPDIVLIDARFSPDRYEVAARLADGSLTPFQSFETSEFIDTGVAGPVQPPGDRPFRFSTLFGLPIELDDFGVAANGTVSAIQFRSLPLDSTSTPQGDPVMAAVLNSTPAVPEPTSLVIWLLIAAAGFRLRPQPRKSGLRRLPCW